jgi:hypothetical protein
VESLSEKTGFLVFSKLKVRCSLFNIQKD